MMYFAMCPSLRKGTVSGTAVGSARQPSVVIKIVQGSCRGCLECGSACASAAVAGVSAACKEAAVYMRGMRAGIRFAETALGKCHTNPTQESPQ